jgi:hypothetical protein
MSLSNSIGVENNMQLDESADDIGDELSSGALKDFEQYIDTYDHSPLSKEVNDMSPDVQTAAVQHENFDVETPIYDPTKTKVVVQRDKAAILEASTPSRKSKRRAQSTDEHSLDRAEWIKAAHNLRLHF